MSWYLDNKSLSPNMDTILSLGQIQRLTYQKLLKKFLKFIFKPKPTLSNHFCFKEQKGFFCCWKLIIKNEVKLWELKVPLFQISIFKKVKMREYLPLKLLGASLIFSFETKLQIVTTSITVSAFASTQSNLAGLNGPPISFIQLFEMLVPCLFLFLNNFYVYSNTNVIKYFFASVAPLKRYRGTKTTQSMSEKKD